MALELGWVKAIVLIHGFQALVFLEKPKPNEETQRTVKEGIQETMHRRHSKDSDCCLAPSNIGSYGQGKDMP